MSCPQCGGMLPDELAAAMDDLVCERAVIEGPHCHCHDVDGATLSGSQGEEPGAGMDLTDTAEASRPTPKGNEVSAQTRERSVNPENRW